MIKPVTRRPARDVSEDVLQRLATCMGVRRNNDKGHTRVQSAVTDFIHAVQDFLGDGERQTLRLVVRDDKDISGMDPMTRHGSLNHGCA